MPATVRVTLRMDRRLHATAKGIAARMGVSLNDYVSARVAADAHDRLEVDELATLRDGVASALARLDARFSESVSALGDQLANALRAALDEQRASTKADLHEINRALYKTLVQTKRG